MVLFRVFGAGTFVSAVVDVDVFLLVVAFAEGFEVVLDFTAVAARPAMQMLLWKEIKEEENVKRNEVLTGTTNRGYQS